MKLHQIIQFLKWDFLKQKILNRGIQMVVGFLKLPTWFKYVESLTKNMLVHQCSGTLAGHSSFLRDVL